MPASRPSSKQPRSKRRHGTPTAKRPLLKKLRAFLHDPLNLISLFFILLWTGFVFFKRPIGDYGVETDFYGDFVPTAKRWMDGEPSVMSGFRGPFYYLVLGVLGSLFRDYFLIGKLISVFSAGVGLRITGGLLRRFWTPKVGVYGTLFIVANPVFLEYTYRACTDMLFWLLFTASLALLFSGDPHRMRSWMFAGVLAGAAWLTRYNGGVLVPAAMLIALVTFRPLPRGIRPAMGFLVAWLLVIAPWSLYLWSQTGDPFWNRAFQNVAMEIYPSSASQGNQGNFMSEVGFASLIEVWEVYPAQFFQVVSTNLFEHLWQDIKKLVGIGWAGAALLGVLAGRRRWIRKELAGFFLVAVLMYTILLPVFYNQRFMLPLLLWWAFAVGVLGDFLGEQLNALTARIQTRGAPFLRNLVVLVLVSFVIFHTSRQMRESMDPEGNKAGATEILELATTLKGSGLTFGKRTPIAARKPHVGYYLGSPVIPIPLGTIEVLRESGAHYLLVSGIEVNWSISLHSLMVPEDLSKIPKQLTFLAQVLVPLPNNQARAASLYALKDPIPWLPPARTAPKRDTRVTEGMSRINSLRLRLARWYMLWDPVVSVDPLIRLMSEEAGGHAETLLLRGDLQMAERDPGGAMDTYNRILEEDPENKPATLRMATLQLLEGNAEASLQTMANYRSLAGEEFKTYLDVGIESVTRGHYAASIAPLQATVNEQDPRTFLTGMKLLGNSLTGLGWYPEARTVYERFLGFSPDDKEVKLALKSLEIAIEPE